MPNVKPELNPQPEPPSPALILIAGIGKQGEASETVEIVTPAGVIEVNLRTHTVTLKHPEMGIPGWWAGKALASAIATWNEARNVRGLEEVHAEAERLLVCSVDAVVKAANRAREYSLVNA